jgi:hypothetical protein
MKHEQLIDTYFLLDLRRKNEIIRTSSIAASTAARAKATPIYTPREIPVEESGVEFSCSVVVVEFSSINAV